MKNLIKNNVEKFMEAKGLVEKKTYTMTKNKSVVKNKVNNDELFKIIMGKLSSLDQQSENKVQ